MAEPAAAAASTSSGFGRVLVAVYGVFALAATARSVVQIATKWDEAPVAYLLSGLAGVVYIVATIGLARAGAGWTRVALWAVRFELVGVVTVGLLTITDSSLFPDATVWSRFGQGYGYVPLVLPFVGLWWLRRVGAARAAEAS